MSTLDDTCQMMIVNAACHAIAMNQETERMAIADRVAPHVVLRAKVYPDGDKWCCLYGDNLQDGVAGFGDTPAKAANDFDTMWLHGANAVFAPKTPSPRTTFSLAASFTHPAPFPPALSKSLSRAIKL